MTRRTFTYTAALPLFAQHKPVTAREGVDRIESGAAIAIGDPATPLRGIATTAMATMDVLTRAVKQNCNLIVTLEPVFFSRADSPLPEDSVYLGKKSFIEKNGLVVWRLTDRFRTRRPDPFATGLARALGWPAGPDPLRYEIRTKLGELAATLKKHLQARAGIRVVGDPQTTVRRIALLPGVSPLSATMAVLPEADVVIAGETREWESVEYAADTVASGQKKGFIMLGRVLSQDPGMNVCVDYLRTLIPEVSVKWVPAGDPYWRPV